MARRQQRFDEHIFVQKKKSLTCDKVMLHFLASSSLASSDGYGLLR